MIFRQTDESPDSEPTDHLKRPREIVVTPAKAGLLLVLLTVLVLLLVPWYGVYVSWVGRISDQIRTSYPSNQYKHSSP